MRQRKASQAFLSSLKNFDAYAKPLDDFQVKTVSGASVTVISLLLIVFLLLSEFSDWASREFKPSIRIDPGRKEKMVVHVDVSFPHIPCFLVGIDVMDVAGDFQNDISTDMFKQRLDRSGNPIHKKKQGKVGEKTSHDIVEAKRNGTYCGNCYGASNGCCNTCDDIKAAYEKVAWSLKDLDNYEQV